MHHQLSPVGRAPAAAAAPAAAVLAAVAAVLAAMAAMTAAVLTAASALQDSSRMQRRRLAAAEASGSSSSGGGCRRTAVGRRTIQQTRPCCSGPVTLAHRGITVSLGPLQALLLAVCLSSATAAVLPMVAAAVGAG
jgi:hypothetical protein